MSTTPNAVKRKSRKSLSLDPAKLKKAQKLLGAESEAETIERALDRVIDEAEANRRAWQAHERFVKDAIQAGIQIEDVYGRLEKA